MGNCATSPETNEEYEKYIAAEKEISLDSDKSPLANANSVMALNNEEYLSMSNENKELRLMVRIDRIKVRNVSYNGNLYCIFKFAEVPAYKTHTLISSGSYWRSQYSFEYIAQEGMKSLREKTLEVELWTSNQGKESDMCIGRVSISIKKICEGPFHIDYPLKNSKNSSAGRISFNCTIEQNCVWGLRFTKAELHMKNTTEIDVSEGSLWSVGITKCLGDLEDTYHSSDTSIPVITDQGEIDRKHQLIELVWNEDDLFTISTSCTFREFVNSPLKLQVRIMKTANDAAYSIKGECWISIEKAYSLFIRHPNRVAELRHHIWSNGMTVGDISVFYQFNNVCMIQQMLSGVNSEKGISAGSTVIVSDYSKGLFKRENSELPASVLEIVRLYKTWIDLKTSLNHNDKEQVDLLERITGYLRNTEKDSMVAFVYKSEAALLKTQCLFLEMLDMFAGSLFDLAYTVKNVVFEVIFRLLKRSELSDLSLLGFDPGQDSKKPSKENIEFAANMRRVLIHILKDTLDRMSDRGISQRLSVYCSRIISICMFRIPAFGEEVIHIIWDYSYSNTHSCDVSPSSPMAPLYERNKSFAGSQLSLFGSTMNLRGDSDDVSTSLRDRPLKDLLATEGGGITSQFVITQKWLYSILHTCKIRTSFSDHDLEENDLLGKLLDWGPIEAAVMQYYEEHGIPCNDTDFFIMDEDWKTRIAMKGNLYYLILEAWLQKVLSIMTNMHREIQWNCIRGYPELLLSFAVQLESIPLTGYTEVMTKVMRTFLSNENTLSLFLRILLMKTNANSIQEVSFVVELIDSLLCSYRRWSDRLERTRHPNTPPSPVRLPSTLCDYPFVDSVLMLLASDLNQVVIKTMELLYHHWDILRDSHKHTFLSLLLSGEYCRKFFLHWNLYVRQFYQYLIIYWIQPGMGEDKKGKIDVYSFMREFTKVHSQKTNALRVKNEETVRLFLKEAEIDRNTFRLYEREITEEAKRQPRFKEFCSDLDIFSKEEFMYYCHDVIQNYSVAEGETIFQLIQLLSLVYTIQIDGSSYYCCSLSLLSHNYDSYVFNTQLLDIRHYYYQDQVLYSRFNSFVRNIRRIAIRKIDKERGTFEKKQASLREAIPNCHNEAINKFNMQQVLIDKILKMDIKSIYEDTLVCSEVVDAVLEGKNYTIPTTLYPYLLNAIMTYDDMYKKHERDQARNNKEAPFLHWQTVFPTSQLSSWD